MSRSPATITREELQALHSKLSVQPSDYTKPIRVYVDVNGVIQPYVRSKEELAERFPDAVDIDVLPRMSWNEVIELDHGKFWWNKEAVARLAALSRHPQVDFVWLTDWRVSAPHALDSLLNIKSIGFLDWQQKMSDYDQVFKRFAIREEQEESPSKFIWIDDRANIPYPGHPHVFAEEKVGHEWEYDEWEYDEELNIINEAEGYLDTIPQSRYLNVITDGVKGLTVEDMDAIEAWIQENI